MSPAAEEGCEVLLPVVRWSAAAEATLDSLRRQLGNPEALRVLEAAGARERHEEDSGDVESAWELALDHLLQNPGRDVLVVLPGILAASLLDLRLLWSADAADGVALVSPLCDLDPVTSLARHGVSGPAAFEIDDRIAGGGPHAVVDAPYPLPECCFVRGGLARRAFTADGPRSFAELVRGLRREGLLFGLAPHVFVGSVGRTPRREPWLEGPAAMVFLAESPLHEAARRACAGAPRPGARSRARPRLLHVSHSLGGGLESWVELFVSACSRADNFVLKSIGERGRFGSQLWLYAGANPWTPLKTWQLAPPIEGSAVSHLGYRRALEEIVAELGIDGVVVSSLIGHSLDALRTAVPTALVLHDYFPFCPALHIHFDGICTDCGERRLGECLRANPLNNLFDRRDPREWLVLREAFLAALSAAGVKVVAPSPSVVRHLRQLAPRSFDIAVVPHGSDARDLWPRDVPREELREEPREGPLRVLVLGRVHPIKGEELLKEIVAQSGPGVRFFLVGSGERGRALAGREVEVVEEYDRRELPALLARIAPDVGLFLSVVPETFSFTLDECFNAGIPPVALRTGSFGDRIEDGVDGFLCEPDAASVLARLERLAADRKLVAGAREALGRRAPRSASEMVAEYAAALGLPEHSRRAYFARSWGLATGDSAGEEGGYRLPAGSPLGFAEFLRQVETGTLHHIRQTRRLPGWQRGMIERTASAGFRTTRLLMRWLGR